MQPPNSIQIADPEAARQFRQFGKIITMLTRERLRILKSQRSANTEAGQ